MKKKNSDLQKREELTANISWHSSLCNFEYVAVGLSHVTKLRNVVIALERSIAFCSMVHSLTAVSVLMFVCLSVRLHRHIWMLNLHSDGDSLCLSYTNQYTTFSPLPKPIQFLTWEVSINTELLKCSKYWSYLLWCTVLFVFLCSSAQQSTVRVPMCTAGRCEVQLADCLWCRLELWC